MAGDLPGPLAPREAADPLPSRELYLSNLPGSPIFRTCSDLRSSPIPEDEQLLNLGLFLTPQALSRLLFMDFLYRQTPPAGTTPLGGRHLRGDHREQ